MHIKIFFSSVVVLLTANIISCSKEQNNSVRNTNVNSTGSGESAVIPAVCDQFKYPDSIFYAAELPGDYEVKPVNKLNGTFGAYPDGLDIDPFTGELEIGESETGLKYLVWFVPVRTKDTAIAGQRPEESVAAGAFVEINAHIGWHCFLRLITAFGTRQNGDICFGHNVR